MSTNVKSLLESLEDFVLNQDKIVTYRWLSKKLNIHVNTSKQLLYTFSKSPKCDLVTCYLICGSTSDGIEVIIVNEGNVDKVKSGLDAIISEHVYSVQKSCSPVTSSDLYLANITCEPSNNNKLGSILPREIEYRDINVVLLEKTVVPARVEQHKEPLKNSISNSSNEKKKPEEVSEPDKQGKNKKVVQVASKKSPVKNKILSPVKNNKKKMVQSKERSIGAFFNKQCAANTEKKKNELLSKPTTNVEDNSKNSKKGSFHEDNIPSDEDKPSDFFDDNEPSEELQPVKTPVVKRKKTLKNAVSKKRKNRSDDDTPAKRRKRIVLASDSESSGEDEEEGTYVEQEPDPEYNRAAHKVSDSEDEVIPPTPFDTKVKKRIRKQINKTFVDEDGFVITEKEFVYASCSDEERHSSPIQNAASKTDKISPVSSEPKTEQIAPVSSEPKTTEQIATVSSKPETVIKPLEIKNNQEREEKNCNDKKKVTTKETKRGAKKVLNKVINKQSPITSFFKPK